MNTPIHSARKIVTTFALVLCVSATLAGCKSGGGGSTESASASTTGTPLASTAAPAPAVASTNTAPNIEGTTTSSVVANNLYSFKPAASDANGDALSFAVQNKPVWATFSTVTGQLSGTPTVANAGTFANIVISVSDGVATTTMPAFSIAVTAPTVNSATLSWSAPTQNTDGSALSDLAGFTVVYGTSEAALDQTVRIDNATATTWSMDNFSSGTYYFAIKAFTAGGAESGLSSVVSKAF